MQSLSNKSQSELVVCTGQLSCCVSVSESITDSHKLACFQTETEATFEPKYFCAREPLGGITHPHASIHSFIHVLISRTKIEHLHVHRHFIKTEFVFVILGMSPCAILLERHHHQVSIHAAVYNPVQSVQSVARFGIVRSPKLISTSPCGTVARVSAGCTRMLAQKLAQAGAS